MNSVSRENPDDYGAAPRRARGVDEHCEGLRYRHLAGAKRFCPRGSAVIPQRNKDVMSIRNAGTTTGRPTRVVLWMPLRSIARNRAVEISVDA